MTEKILVALSWANNIPASPQVIQRLRDKGWEVVFNTAGRNLTPDEVIAMLPGISASIAGSEKYTAPAFDAANSLRVISRVGVGFDAIDLAAATKKGVIATTSPVRELFEAMADQTFGLMIGISRHIPQANNGVKAGQWKRIMGPHLFHRTLGIVGLGRIGKEVAKLGKAFQMRLLCYDVFHDAAFAAEHGLTYVDLPELLREADYVTVHTPLNNATRGLMNRERFQMMKPTAYLVNTSRGPVVDEEDLYWALTNGVIAGAATDVFGKEPPDPANPLLTLDNFIATPHIGGLSLQAVDAMFASATQSVIDVLEGRKPYLVVNPEVYEAR
ncbi:MAG: phosphoglycerate dehydrogenase [Chloroflexota bacterium]